MDFCFSPNFGTSSQAAPAQRARRVAPREQRQESAQAGRRVGSPSPSDAAGPPRPPSQAALAPRELRAESAQAGRRVGSPSPSDAAGPPWPPSQADPTTAGSSKSMAPRPARFPSPRRGEGRVRGFGARDYFQLPSPLAPTLSRLGRGRIEALFRCTAARSDVQERQRTGDDMLKLIIGNKAYSSWSLRGWLAVKQSGLAFEEITVPLFDEEWEKTREGNEFAPSGGKVPVLWDDQAVIWDSLAIVEWLSDRTDRDRYWPKDEVARGMARSMAAEMHSSYDNLRRECPMNLRKQFPPREMSENVRQEVVRILELWAQARARHGGGGPYLFGTFGAVDIMFAPVITRFVTYSIPVPRFAAAYMEGMLSHPWLREWVEAAQEEPWVIEKYETAGAE
jgi:glutathione S-transferase